MLAKDFPQIKPDVNILVTTIKKPIQFNWRREHFIALSLMRLRIESVIQT